MNAGTDEPRAVPLPSFREWALTFLIVCAVAFPFVLGLGMTQNLSHDEHQHVAAGALIAREGLMPYRDFPHFHTPYLAYGYAALFSLTDHLLVAARMVSVLSATAILGIIGTFAYHLFRHRGRRFASCVSGGSVLLAMMTTLFTETTGLAYNHEPSLALALAAFTAHLAGLKSGRLGWVAAGGLLLGLAFGTRITYAPLVAPFGLALLLFPTPQWRWRQVLGFSGGLLLGLAGLLYLFAVVPEQALFGNFGFASANIDYRYDVGEPRTMTLLKKLRFFFKGIVRPDAALFLAALLPFLAAFLANRKSGRRWPMELKFILLLLPFIFIGSFAPSPMHDQYFYPFIPFLLLAGLYCFAAIPAKSPWFLRTKLTAAALVLLAVGMGFRGYNDLSAFFTPSRWRGVRLHARVSAIRDRIPPGRVLTFAPIHALEAGRSIYPALSTGPFAWRIAPYVDAAKNARLGIVGAATMAPMLAATPPTGIHVGFEETGEEPLTDYAKQQGFESFTLSEDSQIWFPKAAGARK